VKVGPKAKSEIRKPCVGSINKEEVAPQAAEWGIMDALAKRPSVKVRQSVVHHQINKQLNPSLFWCLGQNIYQPHCDTVLFLLMTGSVCWP
jgi:hypothetical protein